MLQIEPKAVTAHFDGIQTFSMFGSMLTIIFSTNSRNLSAWSCSFPDKHSLDWISLIGIPLNAGKNSQMVVQEKKPFLFPVCSLSNFM